MTDAIHANIAVLEKLDMNNLETCADIFSEDFVWHYFNPKLPGVQGDYRGFGEFKGFFEKLGGMTGNSLQVNPISAQPVGDELVVVQTCNRITFEGRTIEFDVVVVWRFAEGKIAEAWDIPSVYEVRDV